MKKLLFLLAFCAFSAKGQTVTITRQPTNQTVVVGQEAVFTAKASAPCRTVFYHNGASTYGPITDTATVTTSPVSSANNGDTYWVEFYACTGQVGADLVTSKAVLTVTAAPPPPPAQPPPPPAPTVIATGIQLADSAGNTLKIQPGTTSLKLSVIFEMSDGTVQISPATTIQILIPMIPPQ